MSNDTPQFSINDDGALRTIKPQPPIIEDTSIFVLESQLLSFQKDEVDAHQNVLDTQEKITAYYNLVPPQE